MSKSKFSRNSTKKIGAKKVGQSMLIVCEGETEVNYLEEFRKAKRAPRELIRIEKSRLGTNPKNIIDSAIEILKQQPSDYDYVFLVFDRDNHKAKTNSFQLFLNRIKDLNEEKSNPLTNVKDFKAILSVPCTELWFLLHYNDSPGIKDGITVIRELKTKPGFKDYEKAKSDAYAPTKELISTAIKHAVLRQNEHLNDNLPFDKYCYTNMNELVTELTKIPASL